MQKLGLILTVVSWLLVMPSFPAQAYLDPGSGSMFLQLLLGGLAGLAVLLKLYWHRFLSLFGVSPQESEDDSAAGPAGSVGSPPTETEAETSGEQ